MTWSMIILNPHTSFHFLAFNTHIRQECHLKIIFINQNQHFCKCRRILAAQWHMIGEQMDNWVSVDTVIRLDQWLIIFNPIIPETGKKLSCIALKEWFGINRRWKHIMQNWIFLNFDPFHLDQKITISGEIFKLYVSDIYISQNLWRFLAQ